MESEAKAYYDEQGYVIFNGLIPDARIDRLTSCYQRDILHSKHRFYRQNTNAYDRNRHTEHGHVIQSFLDIHHYRRFPEFRAAALDLYFCSELMDALNRITCHPSHHLMQSMMFDANAATVPHQDWWYLDSVPNGHLLGAWIALEDIDEQAGRFFVMPGSQRTRLHQDGMRHSDWLARVKAHMDAHPDQVRAPALRKGDVLFWNSGTIHGALPTQDRRYSRKSLTAHFMPSGMEFGNLFTRKPWIQYEEYNGHRYFANQPEYSLKADWLTKIKVAAYDKPWLIRLLRRFQRGSIARISG